MIHNKECMGADLNGNGEFWKDLIDLTENELSLKKGASDDAAVRADLVVLLAA